VGLSCQAGRCQAALGGRQETLSKAKKQKSHQRSEGRGHKPNAEILKAENRNQRPSAVEQQRNKGTKLNSFRCHRQAAALGRFADLFAKGSASDPVGNHCPVANRHVFAPRHGPLVWHCLLKHELKQKT